MCLAIPGRLQEINGNPSDPVNLMGKVNFSGIVKEVSLAYVPEVKLGEYVLVHVGFALSVVDDEEAQKVFSYLKQMGELSELEQ